MTLQKYGVASDGGKLKYKFVRTIKTNISADYLEGDWAEWEALREIFQNAIDEGTRLARESGGDAKDYLGFRKKGQWFIVEDKGAGFNWQDLLLIGYSGKRTDQEMIGEKGEGELLSSLVFAKLGLEKWVFSKDWALYFRIEQYAEGGADVLVADLFQTKSGKCRRGTRWTFQGNATIAGIFRDRGDYFIALESKLAKQRRQTVRREQAAYQAKYAAKQAGATYTTSKTGVWVPTGRQKPSLYFKGSFVKLIDSAFCLNATSISINRDRSMVDLDKLYDMIGSVLSDNDDTNVMAVYWRNALTSSNASNNLEYHTADIWPVQETKRLWVDAFKAVYGERACIAGGDPFIAADATSEGWSVVKLTYHAAALAEKVGIMTDREVLHIGDEDIVYKDFNKRDEQVIRLFKDVSDCLGITNGASVNVAVVTKIYGRDRTEGLYLPDGKIICINDTMMQKPSTDGLETYLHELGHLVTGEGDFERAFTDWFLKGWVSLMNNIETMLAVSRIVEQLKEYDL